MPTWRPAVIGCVLLLACGGNADSRDGAKPRDEAAPPGSSTAPSSEASPALPAAGAAQPASPPAVSPPATQSCSHPEQDYITHVAATCSSRVLPDCPRGSAGFNEACGCGCSEVAAYPRACRINCDLQGRCNESTFEEAGDYATTLRSWPPRFEDEVVAAAAGECEGGLLFLFSSNGFLAQSYFFTPEGWFLGFSTQGDGLDETCGGATYWPEPVRCENAKFTRIISPGLSLDASDVGREVGLPWAGGAP
jgi:hypothetical protein